MAFASTLHLNEAPEQYALALTQQEVNDLLMLLGHISGSPTDSVRRSTTGIWSALLNYRYPRDVGDGICLEGVMVHRP